MSDQDEGRSHTRESLFLLADLRLPQGDDVHRIKVRNLSPGGMMVDCDIVVTPGQNIAVKLQNIPWIEGQVAWVEENRFGVAFSSPIDASKAKFTIARVNERPPSPPSKSRGPLFRL